MTDTFISYSRKDKIFVQRIFEALAATGRSAWVDWESIPFSAEWWQEIQQGINSADNFIVIVSQHWLASEICNKELAYAYERNKRVIPIIRNEVDVKREMASIWFGSAWESQARENWNLIGKLNWLYFRKREDADCECQYEENTDANDPICDGPQCDLDNFEKSFQALLQTVETDIDHVRQHTRLLIRAREWELDKNNDSLLLRGDGCKVRKWWEIQDRRSKRKSVEFCAYPGHYTSPLRVCKNNCIIFRLRPMARASTVRSR